MGNKSPRHCMLRVALKQSNQLYWTLPVGLVYRHSLEVDYKWQLKLRTVFGMYRYLEKWSVLEKCSSLVVWIFSHIILVFDPSFFLSSLFQIALQFPYRFWDRRVQGADYFGHVPPSPENRGMFSVFYDMDPKVRGWCWTLNTGTNMMKLKYAQPWLISNLFALSQPFTWWNICNGIIMVT